MPVPLEPDRPFRILLMGDFSGRSSRPVGSFKPHRIDRDNFDEVLGGMKITLVLQGIALSFRELDDFHPDRIYQSAAIFRNLDQLVESEPADAPAPVPVAPREIPAGLLDQILAEHHGERSVSARDADDLAAFVREATAGQVVPRKDPSEERREAKRQELAAKLLRGILHHPQMQAVEAAWRAVFMLVLGLETDGGLQLYVLDITLPELIREMDAVQEELKKTGPWAAMAGNYAFDQSDVAARALGRLADMASRLGAPLICEARLSGGMDTAWLELRRSKEARWVGLAVPRFLLRLPYGRATSPIESFPFEEMPTSEHAAYLWGNPAFFCAQLIGQSFTSHGWELGRKLARRLDGLALHVYHEDGEAVTKPCAEVLMNERDAENLLESGFMPLVSIKDEPAAMIVRFQSIAEPLAPLVGLA